MQDSLKTGTFTTENNLVLVKIGARVVFKMDSLQLEKYIMRTKQSHVMAIFITGHVSMVLEKNMMYGAGQCLTVNIETVYTGMVFGTHIEKMINSQVSQEKEISVREYGRIKVDGSLDSEKQLTEKKSTQFLIIIKKSPIYMLLVINLNTDLPNLLTERNLLIMVH